MLLYDLRLRCGSVRLINFDFRTATGIKLEYAYIKPVCGTVHDCLPKGEFDVQTCA
jgi:hypothetical protein